MLRSLLELLHQITLTQFAPACAQQSLYSAQIRAFAEQLKPEQVQLYYQILLTGRKDLPHAPDPKSGLEMALLRAVAFVPEKPVKRWQPDAVAEISLSEGQTPVATAQVTDVKEQKFSEPPTAEQLPAEKKTALIEPADTAEQALDAELQADAALIAEQAVILSQAQSQGFNAGSLNVEIVNAEVEPQTQTVSTAQASLMHTSESVAGIEVSVASIDTQNIQGIELVTTASEPSLVNTAEPETAVNSTVVECGDSVDKALFDKDPAAKNIFDNNIDNNAFELGHDANRIHGNEAEHSYSAMEDYALESAPLDSYQDVYADFSSGAYNDDNFNHGFDSKEAINSVDVQSSVGVSNAAGMQASADRQSAPVAQVFTQSQTSVSDSIQDQALQQAASASLADDDILSAVLAARDSLLSDLDALSAKDGDEKKSSLDSKLKTPNTKSHGVTLPKSVTKIEASQPSVAFSVDPASDLDPDLAIDFDDDFDLDLEPIDLHQAVSSVVISTGIVSEKPVKPSAADDRPPWEAAPEAESIEVTQVDSNKTDSVQPVSAQATDINNVQASHAQELLGESYAPNHAQDDTLSLSDGQVAASSLKSEILQNQAVRQEEIPASEFASASTTALTNASNTVEHTQETQVALSSTQPISGHPLDLHWYKLMASLEIGGRVRQLAVNSVCQTLSDPLPLLLKPNQKHLAADVAIVQLEQALTTALGNPRRVQVVIGIDEQRETPLELRKRFHQELLQQAHQSLIHDDNVQWLIQRMGAELDADSLVYPPELLNLRSQQIQALPELTEAAS